MNNKYKGVIFDLDGTLLYTLQDITDALNYAIIKNGLKEITTDDARFMVGSGAKVLIERVIDHNPYVLSGKVLKTKELFDSLYNDYMDKYKDICTVTTKPYNGIVRTLNVLKRLGYKLAVLSNKPQRDTESVINRYFDKGTFDVVFGGREGVPLKPNPEAVYEVIKLLGLNKDDLYVAECYADKGPTMKRIHPRAQGRAYRIEKRMSHITIVLDEK